MDELTKQKRIVLKKMVEALTELKDLYYMEEMLIEPNPKCLGEMESYIHNLRRELAGA